MRKLITLFFAFSTISAMASLTGNDFAVGTPVETYAPVEHVFVPNGFDSNDRSQVVITGYLPNWCHKKPISNVEMSEGKIEVSITTLYYHSSNPFCPEIITPFMEIIELGRLDEGNFEIVVNGKSEHEYRSKLHVEEPKTHQVDNAVYAAVNQVVVTPGSDVVELKGVNPGPCFELDEIKYVHNNVDTYAVLPVMKVIGDIQDCPKKMTPFSYKWKVPGELKRPEVLLHVRSMNGNAVNQLYRTNLMNLF